MAFKHTNRQQTGRSDQRQAELSRSRPMDELYSSVTERIVAELEEGRLPWVQPWVGAVVAAGLPQNASSGRAYSGINILILWHALFEGGFAAQRWLTFKQAEALGGHVRKGERGVTVCYADRFTPKDAMRRVSNGLTYKLPLPADLSFAGMPVPDWPAFGTDASDDS